MTPNQKKRLDRWRVACKDKGYICLFNKDPKGMKLVTRMNRFDLMGVLQLGVKFGVYMIEGTKDLFSAFDLPAPELLTLDKLGFQ